MPEVWSTGPDSSVVEVYRNTFTPWTAIRHWMDPRVLVGGSILGVEDWKHLQRDFKVTHCLSVESERSDDGKGIEDLIWLPIPDNGRIPGSVFLPAIYYADWVLTHDTQAKLYVHCQMGGSRSPAIGYAILRGVLCKTPKEALASIRRALPDWGTAHPYHFAYMESAENVIRSMGMRVRA